MAEILFKEESYKIIGACFEVYEQKVCGFTEPVIKSVYKSNLRYKRFHLWLSQP